VHRREWHCIAYRNCSDVLLRICSLTPVHSCRRTPISCDRLGWGLTIWTGPQ